MCRDREEDMEPFFSSSICARHRDIIYGKYVEAQVKNFVIPDHWSNTSWTNIGDIASVPAVSFRFYGSDLKFLVTPTVVHAFDVDSTVLEGFNPSKGSGPPTTAVMMKRRKKVMGEIDSGLVALLTNQLWIGKGSLLLSEVQSRMDDMMVQLQLNVPAVVIMAPDTNAFRKPGIGMPLLLDRVLLPGGVDWVRSYYVGDAAGRPKTGTMKRDHSKCDLAMALNSGMSFYTPEAYFSPMGRKKLSGGLSGVSKTFTAEVFAFPIVQDSPVAIREFVERHKTNAFMIVGPPGAGKTLLCCFIKQWIGATVINQDTIGSIAKVKKCIMEAPGDKAIVIDRTHPDSVSRSEILKTVDDAGKWDEKFAIVLVPAKELALRGNEYRNVYRSCNKKKVPPMVVHSFYKKYEAPDIKEGFEDIFIEKRKINWGTEPESLFFSTLH